MNRLTATEVIPWHSLIIVSEMYQSCGFLYHPLRRDLPPSAELFTSKDENSCILSGHALGVTKV